MTPDEFREALSSLGWSQRQAARELGVGPRLVRYWAVGRYPIPRVAQLALAQLLSAASEERGHIPEPYRSLRPDDP